MKVKIEFNTDNAAFGDMSGARVIEIPMEFYGECRYVLEQVGDRIERFPSENNLSLRDSNGNKVGTVEVVE